MTIVKKYWINPGQYDALEAGRMFFVQVDIQKLCDFMGYDDHAENHKNCLNLNSESCQNWLNGKEYLTDNGTWGPSYHEYVNDGGVMQVPTLGLERGNEIHIRDGRHRLCYYLQYSIPNSLLLVERDLVTFLSKNGILSGGWKAISDPQIEIHYFSQPVDYPKIKNGETNVSGGVRLLYDPTKDSFHIEGTISREQPLISEISDIVSEVKDILTYDHSKNIERSVIFTKVSEIYDVSLDRDQMIKSVVDYFTLQSGGKMAINKCINNYYLCMMNNEYNF